MYLWGKDAKYATLDFYDGGNHSYFTVESFVEPGTPIVVPMGKKDLQNLIRLLTVCLSNYESDDE